MNAQVYVRGHASDYDRWAAQGCEGWAFRDVLPYFRKCENYEPAGERVDDFHGRGGPLNVAERRYTNPLSEAFVEAAERAGHPRNDDLNGPVQDGVGQYRVYQKAGERCSNARAYLHPSVMYRDNLEIRTGVHVTRVLLEGGRATGIEYRQNGKVDQALAKAEVVLCAGAFNSPQILMLSGIGPRKELERHGIAVRHALEGVGQNLQDHIDVFLRARSKTRVGISMHPSFILRGLWAVIQYLFARRGILTSNGAEAGGFIKSNSDEPIPDLQLHFTPMLYSDHGRDLKAAMAGYGYAVMIYGLRPLSRGHVGLKSSNPLDAPLIDPNYFSAQQDVDLLVQGIRRARDIFQRSPLAGHQAMELSPGNDLQSDEALAEWVRKNAESAYHPVGTCKMGNDPLAVVDSRLKVHGVSCLRVVDASIMPTLVGGNTNQPATMIGEKGAEMILEDAARKPFEPPKSRSADQKMPAVELVTE
eukprot:TRINITY_DN13480_c0_g1_i19.p2 TRINITY_DN13480_c0_g1~~TRINITY_DN13480_c0_g1_i19.p2  ORF type:complete len:474 (+),score=84.23 TRINITY_DN13480_c0_g1_i19:82-1503(+)